MIRLVRQGAAALLWSGRYLWAYLVVIALFGFIFLCLPAGSFHDSNIQFEPNFAADRNRLLTALSAEYDQEQPSHLQPFITADGSQIILQTESIRELDVSSGSIDVLISGSTESLAGGTESVPFEEYVSLGGTPFDEDAATVRDNTVAIEAEPVEGQGLLGQGAIPISELMRDGELVVSTGTYDTLLNLVDESQGDPESAGQAVGRFAYLSMVTITTLGFGDITPVTTEARLLVGFEAVLGIVIIGLFLNNLAKGRGNGREP